jgi:hypothetical protein
MQSRDTVVGIFHDRDDAQDAINALRDAGFAPDEISVLARDRDQAGALAAETGTEAGAGAATGALTGGLLGGVAGWLVGIGALAIPGIGPIVAAGPIAAALGGAALGATGGGIIGALTGAGVPEDEARWYDDQVRGGGILVTVNARGRYDEARSIIREFGGRDASSGQSASATSWSETAPAFRSRYETQYGASRRWEDVEPAHRFGYESYGKHSSGGRLMSWSEAERELERDWSASGRSDWSAHRDDVRRGWDFGRGRSRFRDYGAGGGTATEGENRASTAGGSLAGGAIGGVAGAAVGGPLGAAAGAAIGGTAGAMAGDASVESDEERRAERERGR